VHITTIVALMKMNQSILSSFGMLGPAEAQLVIDIGRSLLGYSDAKLAE
jgi:hypothetical protein